MGSERQKQHAEIHRKLQLRKTLLDKAPELPGAFYIPFIGDGDIAVALYKEHKIYGADIDPKRVKTAQSRLPGAEILQADCDTFPFGDRDIEYSLADFDPYSYPYKSFREFWSHAKKASPLILFFTDREKQAIVRSGHWTTPDGKKMAVKNLSERRATFNKYWVNIILPWFTEYIKPWQVVETFKYSRGMQFYWGAIVSEIEEVTPSAAKLKPIKKGAKTAHHQKFDYIKKEAYLEHIRGGLGRSQAARAVGMHPETVSHHLKQYPDFAAEVSRAELEAVGEVENALFEAAKSGNITGIIFYLQNRAPDRWQDRRNNIITTSPGEPLRIEYVSADKKASPSH